jgi:hypothetical protein
MSNEDIISSSESVDDNDVPADEINWGIQHELIVFWAIFTEWPTNSKQFT